MTWLRFLNALAGAGLCCAMCVPAVLAAPPKASALPVADFSAAPPGKDLDAALRGLLRDVVEVIPGRRDLYTQEPQPWSPWPAGVRTACKDDANCEAVLTAEIVALMEEAQRLAGTRQQAGADSERVEQQMALAVTAIDRLCGIAYDAGKYLTMHCGLDRQMTYIAARLWFNLNHESLGLELQREADGWAGSTREWLAGEDMTPAQRQDRLAQLDAAQKSGIPAFQQLESSDDLDGARSQLLADFGNQPRDQRLDDPANAGRVAEIARLSARLGDTPIATRLLSSIDGFGLTPAQAGACDLRIARARADIALARAERRALDARPLLAALRSAGCGQLTVTEDAALAALHGNDPGLARATLDDTLAYCRAQGPCYSARHQRLLELRAVAARDGKALSRLAGELAPRIEAGQATSRERDFAWALARGLVDAGNGANAAEGHALMARLDALVSLGRQSVMGQGAGGAQKNLARYDELKRDLVLGQVQDGATVSPSSFEVLRGQRLYERLRRQRWARALAGVDVPAARAERDANMATLEAQRQALRGAGTDATPYERALLAVAEDMLDTLAQFLEDRYLDAQANAARGTDGYPGFAGGGLQDLAFQDRFATGGFGDDAQRVAAGDAYLSFLRVPGGYLGALVRSRHTVDYEAVSAPQTINRFLAISPAQERTLALWRDLLRTGGGATRGRRGVERDDVETDAQGSPVVDAGGVVLEGVPVWRLADGGYAALDTPPAGAVRVQKPSEISDALFALLLEPFRRDFQDHERLVISPDGALNLLPFETLTRNGTPATELIDIGYVQSLAIYDELRNRRPKEAPGAAAQAGAGDTLLSVADPVYVDGADPLGWQPLPGTREESTRLAALFPANTRLLGADADKKRLFALNAQGSLQRFGLLHFATHGYADAERSALVLSNAAGARDSYFTDEDVATLDLASSLALLSACDTGIGRVVSGDGVVGLPYAFFMAGNRNTLMSLWPVDDAGTAAFMPAYMERLRTGQDLVTALNDTKRAFARGEYGAPLRDPRIWGAFVLYGVAEPLAAGSAP